MDERDERSDRLAVVTGASRGLGRSATVHLARAGWGVIGTYLSARDAADELVAEVARDGGRVVMLPLDVADPGAYAPFADAVRAAARDSFGRDDVDALVNNAGIGLRAGYEETTQEQFDELVAVNLRAPFFLTRALLPLIADGGRVLNVSSGLTRFSRAGSSAYAATKGAVEVLTRYQAVELGGRGIRVNVMAPGATATDFGGGVVRDVPAVNEALAATVPLGRVGEADDIGAAVPLLLADGFAWANGARIELSGGQSI